MRDLITQATALEELQRIVEDLRDFYEVNHAVYHWVNSVGERYVAGTYSPEWIDQYVDNDYVRIDPVVTGCFQRFDPVNWKQLDWSKKQSRDFMQEAIAFGVGTQGFTVPIRGPNGQFAIFTMNDVATDDEWEAFIGDNKADLILIAHAFNERALAFEDGGATLSLPSLSPREISAMTLLAKGLSRAQSAKTMTISEHTLRVYIEAARHKLGAINTTHAVARALALGLIVV
ncbi:MAG: LuxR family transcriptional regulator [Litoreibacter sp.]